MFDTRFRFPINNEVKIPNVSDREVVWGNRNVDFG